MRVLMIVWSDVSLDARVRREAAALAAAGHVVHVVGRGGSERWTPPPGVTVVGVGAPTATRGAVPRRPWPLRVARWWLLPTRVGSVLRRWEAAARPVAAAWKADVVHAHDYTALPLGREVAAGNGAALVYDSHELWPGRPRIGRPTPLRHRRDARHERRLAADAAAVITVGEGVAQALGEHLGRDDIAVVRNSFPLATAEPVASPPRGLVYAGRLAPYRELETLARASRVLAPLRVSAAGPADLSWLARFDRGAVRVLDRLDIDDVDALYREEGLALVSHSDRWPNHRLAMPNKLFHAVRAGVPIVATDVPELRRVVTATGIGVLYRAGDPDDLVRAVREAVDRHAELVTAVRRAAPELSWERDDVVLREIYHRVEGREGAGPAPGRP